MNLRPKRLALLALAALFLAAPVSSGGVSVAVSVGHSSLAIPCGAPVQADWYKPSGTPTGLVWVQHGFVSSKTDVAGFAQDLAAHTGALVVAPTITSVDTDPCWMGGAAVEAAAASLFSGDRAALTASARAAGWTGPMPQRFVLMGHSLGANFAVTVASRLAAQADLRAVVMLDGGSLDNGAQTSAALAALSGTPVLDVASPPNTPCKLGDLAPTLVASRPGQVVGVQLVNGLHLDAIGYSNFVGNVVCGWPRVENIVAVQTLASQWTTNALTGATAGIIGGTRGDRITVGSATAVLLG